MQERDNEIRIAGEFQRLDSDPHIKDILIEMAEQYKKNRPIRVDISYNGVPKFFYNSVQSSWLVQLQHNLHVYIQNYYPLIWPRIVSGSFGTTSTSPDGSITPAGGNLSDSYAEMMRQMDTWIDPIKESPVPGGYLVITDCGKYCVHAICYGNNDWQLGDLTTNIRVTHYRPFPNPPAGYKVPEQKGV